MNPSPETDDRIVRGRRATIMFGGTLAVVAAVVALYGCRIGGDEAEASTPPPANVATAATGAPPTPIPTTTATRVPEGSPTLTPVPVSPTERSTPVIQSPTPAPTATPTRSAVTAQRSVGRVATARSVDGLQRPVDVADNFAPDERVYVSAELTGVRAEAILGIRWKRGGEEIFVYEIRPPSAFSRGYFAFFLDPGGVEGDYAAEIMIDGVVLATVSFTVSG